MAPKRKRSSPVWNYMEKTFPDSAVCLICKDNFKFCGSTTSLTKHLRNKHPSDYVEEHDVDEEPATSKKQKLTQPTLFATINQKNAYKLDSSKKKEIDKFLMQMIVEDLQPFSVVDDKGFRRFVNALDPRYELPSRRELARTHLPNLYREEVSKVKLELENTSAIAMTTDIWTSRTTKGFLTVTAHFITPNWELRSLVLETTRMRDAHTAENIAEEVRNICYNWNILDKVCCVVTDNAANMSSAVSIMKLRHLPCFAHTLNLVVRNSLTNTNEVHIVQEKVKRIVTYFHHSVKASDKLSQLQEQHGLSIMKLIQDVETRWNSTYYMMQRFVQQAELITTTLCLMGKNDMCLNNEELGILTKAVTVLEPFEEITREMSVEKFTSLSKIIPIVRGLQDYMNSSEDVEIQKLYTTFPLGKELQHQMNSRFQVMERIFFIGAATLLDPRFKKILFADQTNVKKIEERLLTRLREIQESSSCTTPERPSSSDSSQSPTKKLKKSIWAKFDAKVESISLVSSTHPSTGAYIEMRRYMEESPILREENPLDWWKRHATLFPNLQEEAKRFLCSPASSVPSERLFSKAGELVSQRRSCLKDTHVDMILFLNKNMNHN